jgi:transposase
MEIFTPPQMKEKRPPGRQPKHTAEFMIMVARKVLEEGMSYREAAKTFNISHGSVHAWILKYKNQEHRLRRNKRISKYKKEVDNYRHEAQVKELKHEIAELYLENLMLKKALKHSLELKKSNSSVITSENLDQLPEVAE